jgi:energy-coupling factor transport system ATP-binding protein
VDTLTYSAVRFAYPDRERAAIDAIDLHLHGGQLVVVAGESGSGKSTLLRAANGIVPHSTGGRFAGTVTVAGRSTREHEPRELTDVVGFVHQDPEAQFVVDHVESDIAFALENLGHDVHAMRRRVEEVLDALAIAHLRDRDPTTLSGGERQRVAIAGALAAAPGVLVLDEPTSQLDPQGAEDVLSAIGRLNSELGTTVLLAEHRLERAAPLADRVVVMQRGAMAADAPPRDALADYAGAPIVVQLGRSLQWDPLPLTVKEARAIAARESSLVVRPAPRDPEPFAPGAELVRGDGVSVTLGGHPALRDVHLSIAAGEIVGLLGRNGAGKSTLLRALAGLIEPARGRIERHARVAYVPQDPNALLSAATARGEVETTLALLGRRDAAPVEAWLSRLHLDTVASRHPRTLSGGERQRLAIAAVAVGGAPVLLLDEPTRGMDAPSRAALEDAIREHAKSGGAVVLATHDVELAARVARRIVVLGDGEVVASGRAREVLAGSLFAPQVLRVLPPFLTVSEVEAACATPR